MSRRSFRAARRRQSAGRRVDQARRAQYERLEDRLVLSTANTPAIFDPAASVFFLKQSNESGFADVTAQFGAPGGGFMPIVGDWDGDGIDTIGLYRPDDGAFFLRNANVSGEGQIFQFGAGGGGALPLAGDFDGNGSDTIGIYIPATGTFFLKNSNDAGPADVAFQFGPTASILLPLAGDWNGDTIDTIGLYDPADGAFFLNDTNAPGAADIAFQYGSGGPGVDPLAGDWNGDGTDGIAVVDSAGGYFLKSGFSAGPADNAFTYGPGISSWIPLAGDFNGPLDDVLPPEIVVGLSNDTAPGGTTNADGITSDVAIEGSIADPSIVERVLIEYDDAPLPSYYDITDDIFVDGPATSATFAFSQHFLFFFTPLGPVDDGPHTLHIRAIDITGRVETFDLPLTFDTAPPVVESGPSGVLDESVDRLTLDFNEPLGGAAPVPADFALTIVGGPNDGQSIDIVSVDVVADDLVALNLAETLPDESFALVIQPLTDVAGNVGTEPTRLDFSVADAAGISEISPGHGASHIGLERETIVRFDQPIDPATVTPDAFHLLANGARIPGNILVSSTELFATFFQDEPLPASTEVRVVVDGGLIRGRDGLALDGDGDDVPGGVATADFSTLPVTRIPATNLFGFVRDSYTGAPIEGATIRVDALPAANVVTDATGRFELVDMPAPEFFVHIDGTTATGAPDGFIYPSVGKAFHTVPGQTTQLNMMGVPFDVYLPPMSIRTLDEGGDITPLSETEPTEVGFGPNGLSELASMFPAIDPAVWARVGVTFAPGSAIDASGTAATQAVIIPVPADRIPAPLPPTLDPQLVISIQALGATNFDVPAPVVFPSLQGQAPGEKALIMSFDHDAGHWIVVGSGTVSEDGLTIASDPGVGILAPGWHLVQVGTQTAGEPCTAGACVQVEGLRGDVIKIDLSGTVALSERPASESNFRGVTLTGGIVAVDASGNPLSEGANPFSQTGIFYAVPEITTSATGAPTGPMTITGSFQADLLREDGTREPQTGVIRIDIQPGWSRNGDAAVPTGALNATRRLDVYRVQQRLRYFGYQDAIGAGAMDLQVDGGVGGRTTHAIGVFRAAAHNLDHVDENSLDVDPFINAQNAPFWVEVFPVGAEPAGITDNEGIHEHWMTSWSRDSVNAANAAYAPVFGFNGASLRGGGDGGHTTHEAGMDIDIDITNAEQADAQAHVGMAVPLTALEQAIVDRMVAFYNAATVPVQRIFVGFQRVVTAFNTATGTMGIAQLDGGNVHDNHFHLDLNPPALIAGLVPLSESVATATTTVSDVPGFGGDPRLFYRFELDNDIVLAARTSADGGFSEVLTPNTGYTVTFYQPSTNRSVVYTGTTNASGIPTELGAIIPHVFGGPDADGDGIPDIGEHAIGTDPGNVDTDGDGISDSAELVQGLNPLDDLGFPTGVIAALPLTDPAQAVDVAGDLVYVATGNAGLAIVDGARFDNPIVLGQLDLPGFARDVGVDPELEIAAIATGGTLELVDVSDPMLPVVLHSVGLATDHVEVFGGLAYTTSGVFHRSIDLVTGIVVQTLVVPGSGNVSDLVREGTMLYAYDSGASTLGVIDAGREGDARLVGQLTEFVGISDVGAFAGNGVVWLAGRGLRTIDVSDPANPTLIHGADLAFSARRLALNGSGLGLVLPETGNTLELYDTSDPNDTDNFLTRFTLAGAPRDLAVSRGIAYVATSVGLEVVNYLQFDSTGLPPTVAIATSVVDVDPVAPGIQVLEGTTIAVLANVDDDVQVRSVDLIVDGSVVRTDVSFPFDLVTAAPNIAPGATSVAFQVRATDTGGNSALSAVVTLELVPDTFPPTIESLDPPDGAQRFQGQRTVRVRFNEPIDPLGATGDTFQIVSAGPSGAFDDGDDLLLPAILQLRDDDRLVQLTTDPLAAGEYRVLIDKGAIADRRGNVLGSGIQTTSFSVVNFEESTEFLPFGTEVADIRFDDVSVSVAPMPFAFEWFGEVVTGAVFVTSNGVVEFFADTIGGIYSNTNLPFGSAKAAFGLWDDHYPPAGGRIGLFDSEGVRAITWEGLPHFGDTSKFATFQIAFLADNSVQIRYGAIELGDGSATIGLSNGTVAAVPSLGNISNKPEVGITGAGGLLDATGLDLLDEFEDVNDILIFTPDGAGGYTIAHNPIAALAVSSLSAAPTEDEPAQQAATDAIFDELGKQQ